MSRQGSDRGHGLSPHLPSIALGAGLLLIGLGLVAHRLFWPPAPGRLVPKQELLSWQSPGEKPFRTLSVDEAQATFEVENVGGLPVRILEAQSSCGCASPVIQPTPIAPGEIRRIEIQAVPLQIGERMAGITLKTDSPISPEIVLKLRIIGNRRPPFMAQAAGDLAFNGDSSLDETREIIAYHVELAGSAPHPPIAKSSLSILKIAVPVVVEEQPHLTPEVVSRKYRFEVSLSSELPKGILTGDVMIVDPWDSDHVQPIRVHGEKSPPIRAVPSRVLIKSHRSDGEKSIANVLIFVNPPVSDLVAELDANETTPLVLSPLKINGDSTRGSFSISLKPGETREGVYNVRIGRSSTTERIVVPVAVRVEDVS